MTQFKNRVNESSQVLQSFYDSSPMMMGVCEVIEGRDIRHISDNKAAAEFFGLRSELTQGRLASELGVPLNVIQTWISHYVESERNMKPKRFGYWHETQHGKLFLSATVSFIEKSREGHSRYSYVVQDLTEMKAAESALQQARSDLEKKVLERTKELSKANSFLQQITNTTEAIIVGLNSDAEVVFFNRYAEEVTGWSANEVIGMNWFDRFLPHQVQKPTLAEFSALLRHTGSHEYENPILTRSGQERVISWRNVVIRDSDQKVTLILATGLDVTRRNQTEERLRISERKFATIFEQAPFAILLVKLRNSVIVGVNHAFTQLFGYESDEVIGKTSVELKLWPDLEVRKKLRIDLESTGAIRHRELHLYDKSRRLVTLSCNIDLIEPEGEQYMLITLQDITEQKQIQESIQRSKAQLEATFQAMNDGVMVFDQQGSVAFLNEAEARITGYETPEEMKKDLTYFAGVFQLYTLDGKLLPTDQWPVSKVMKGESISNWELRGKRLDSGQEWYFSYSGEPVLNDQGKQMLSLIVTRDVTKQKLAEEALRTSEIRFRQLADFLPQIIWTAQPDGSFDYYNERWYQFTELSHDSFGNLDWISILHPDDARKFQETWELSVATGMNYEIEYRLLDKKTNQYRWFLGRAIPIRSKTGRIEKWFGICIDIDEQKRIQEELQKTVRSRDEFLSIASHELKTPLTSLKFQTQWIQRIAANGGSNAYAPERVMKLVHQTDKQVNRLVRLVDDMLDIGRIRSGKMAIQKTEFALSTLVKDVLERLMPQLLASSGGVAPKLECDEDTVGWWDHDRLDQVVTNLLTNAMRYGKGKPIEIRVERNGYKTLLSVRDYGIGVAAEDQQRIFNRFERAISVNEVSGLGLGLFISRQLVEAHGGRIWVESMPDQGSTFYVELPLRLSDEGIIHHVL